MVSIQLSDESVAKLKAALQEEENSCVRLRTYKFGAACQTKIILGLSIDMQNEFDDIALGTFQGIPFIADEEFIEQYGESFSISVHDGRLVVAASTADA
jgi:hypothetical protein